MRVRLMYPDRDVDPETELPPQTDALTLDLDLDTLLTAMAAGDQFLHDHCRRGLLLSLSDAGEIEYRQRILTDCLEHPDAVREVFGIASDAITAERSVFFGYLGSSPDSTLFRAVQVLELFVPILRRLREAAERHAGSFRSDGFGRFFGMLHGELDEEYLGRIEEHLKELRFRRGLLMSANLSKGGRGRRYVVRHQHEQGWLERLSPARGKDRRSFRVPDRDESGFRALGDLRGRGLNETANAAAQSSEHILGFFSMVRVELAFYLGCVNLHERLTTLGAPTCMPMPRQQELALSASGLYDPCLALHVDRQVVGNDVDANDKPLVIVTGANQGGKSTFLRSIGVASLMMQSGLFVAAEAFTAHVNTGAFTHYKREEDASMQSGKLDEELGRMSEIVDLAKPGALVLCNESFASTNEQEGAEIGADVVRGLTDAGARVVLVTHLFELARRLGEERPGETRFLRAERKPDGTRTYRVEEGAPQPTSYGEDAFRRVFGRSPRVVDGARETRVHKRTAAR